MAEDARTTAFRRVLMRLLVLVAFVAAGFGVRFLLQGKFFYVILAALVGLYLWATIRAYGAEERERAGNPDHT